MLYHLVRLVIKINRIDLPPNGKLYHFLELLLFHRLSFPCFSLVLSFQICEVFTILWKPPLKVKQNFISYVISEKGEKLLLVRPAKVGISFPINPMGSKRRVLCRHKRTGNEKVLELG
jgi:hypothetical protein